LYVGDPRYDYGESLEFFNIDEALSYSVQKGTFPVAARDLVCLISVRRTILETGLRKSAYIATSVNDPTAPSEGRGRVRAHLAVAGWVLKQRKEGGGVDASYIVQVDPKGTIPSGKLHYSDSYIWKPAHSMNDILNPSVNAISVYNSLGETHPNSNTSMHLRSF
jgi:hypothetical protein